MSYKPYNGYEDATSLNCCIKRMDPLEEAYLGNPGMLICVGKV